MQIQFIIFVILVLLFVIQRQKRVKIQRKKLEIPIKIGSGDLCHRTLAFLLNLSRAESTCGMGGIARKSLLSVLKTEKSITPSPAFTNPRVIILIFQHTLWGNNFLFRQNKCCHEYFYCGIAYFLSKCYRNSQKWQLLT